MKPFLFFILTATAALVPGPQSAAQEMSMGGKPVPAAPPTTPTAAKPVSRAQEILNRFDKNKDGRLDDDEKADAHEVMLQEQMAKEAPPASAEGIGYFQALALELFDRNHDGQIDEAERAAATAFVERGDLAVTRETLLRRFDLNRDGKLDEAERRESQAYASEHRGELMREILLKRYDVNLNGQFEPEEKTAIRADLMNVPVLPALEAARGPEQTSARSSGDATKPGR
jgi:Ca2+-binding EF-hand superfamily protein